MKNYGKLRVRFHGVNLTLPVCWKQPKCDAAMAAYDDGVVDVERMNRENPNGTPFVERHRILQLCKAAVGHGKWPERVTEAEKAEIIAAVSEQIEQMPAGNEAAERIADFG